MDESNDKIPEYLTGLFETQSFQKAIDNLGVEEPHWRHPCSGCTFIGSYEAPAQADGTNIFDLYVHGDEALTARYGPRLQDYVLAEIKDAEEHRFEAPGHPIIEALRRWKEKHNG